MIAISKTIYANRLYIMIATMVSSSFIARYFEDKIYGFIFLFVAILLVYAVILYCRYLYVKIDKLS